MWPMIAIMAPIAAAVVATAELGGGISYRASLLPCNNSRPAGQWMHYYDNGDGTVTLEFINHKYQPLPKRTVLGVTTIAELASSGEEEAAALVAADPLSATQLLLAAVPFSGDSTRYTWKHQDVWSGGGTVYRPVLDDSQCISTTTLSGSLLRVSACKDMPPPQPDGYSGYTATFYYGPGGLSADASLAMSGSNGGGVPTPALCIVVPSLNATAAD